MAMKIKDLIKQLQGLPPTTKVAAYDIRCVNGKCENAIHLFNLEVSNIEEEKTEEPRKIGF